MRERKQDTCMILGDVPSTVCRSSVRTAHMPHTTDLVAAENFQVVMRILVDIDAKELNDGNLEFRYTWVNAVKAHSFMSTTPALPFALESSIC